MPSYRRILPLVLVLSVYGFWRVGVSDDDSESAPAWELKLPAPNATPVAATEKMPGIYPAGSRIKDREALGGFGPCTNFPSDLNGRDWWAPGAVSIVAFPEESVAYFKHRGIALRVVNRTANVVPFADCDSRLFVICEARDAGGTWREIESPPEAICGNSFHRAFLGSEQYWQFPARLYSGLTKTKIRFRLDPGAGRPAIYSNEFDGQVAVAQFKDREGAE